MAYNQTMFVRCYCPYELLMRAESPCLFLTISSIVSLPIYYTLVAYLVGRTCNYVEIQAATCQTEQLLIYVE
ncbi:hypothetical protein KDH_26670 [Dictyobacter sp. S3.2.2.5]|uniref:Uncharacterized protein n=1 Tax=Dictyobacter halimunensis TaxID=3026934 RepID=A0ABQ6FQG5_9CHLR|nr:hypothetical protein KDH_26670 [Dictyobacter sp. S3.2.2.5]